MKKSIILFLAIFSGVIATEKKDDRSLIELYSQEPWKIYEKWPISKIEENIKRAETGLQLINTKMLDFKYGEVDESHTKYFTELFWSITDHKKILEKALQKKKKRLKH